jgi:DNA-binding IclR family transcriptional regulator
MEERSKVRVRQLSKRLFGAQYRLEVLAQISPQGSLHLTEFSRRLGSPPSISSVQKELKVLVEVGLLEEQDASGGAREVFYRPLPSPLWSCAREVVDQLGSVLSQHSGGINDYRE